MKVRTHNYVILILLGYALAVSAIVLSPLVFAQESSGTLTHEEAFSQLSAAGIFVTSTDNCSDPNISTCTSLEGIRQSTIDEVIALKQACQCVVNVTGGTETGHAEGEFSHGTGYKIDISSRFSGVDSYIQNNCTFIGTRSDGASMYECPSGAIYARESNHWDILSPEAEGGSISEGGGTGGETGGESGDTGETGGGAGETGSTGGASGSTNTELPDKSNQYGYSEWKGGLTKGAARGAAICEEGDVIGDDDVDDVRSTEEDIPGKRGGLFVPVKDFEAEDLLRVIAKDTDAMTEDIDLIEDNTLVIRYYLKRLCEKEYIHDPQFQNEWAKIIGELVNTTYIFVTRAYRGNPIFVNSQYVYYTLVDLAVFETYYEEIKRSKIDKEARDEILRNLAQRQYEYLFPNNQLDELWAPTDLPDKAVDGTEDDPEGWLHYFTLFGRSEMNLPGLFDYTEKELARRRARASEFEKEKLDWGRGFFSYELCDLQIWNDIREDRRNCRIVTPGALIQDQVSLVFGTAIRQMELADEFEERIARNTIIALNDILNWNGFMNVSTSRLVADPSALTPTPLTPGQVFDEESDDILATDDLITIGKLNDTKEKFPWEFSLTVIDLELVKKGSFERLLIDLQSETEETIIDI